MSYISHVDYKKMMAGFKKGAPKKMLQEDLEQEGNAFTAGLAKTKHGGEFNVGDKEDQLKQLEQQIILLLNERIKPNQIIILTNNDGGDSSLKGVKTLGNKKLISTYDREFGRDENCIAQTTINVFKGMEADVIFILDAQNIESNKQLYTQASRAKQLLYVININ